MNTGAFSTSSPPGSLASNAPDQDSSPRKGRIVNTEGRSRTRNNGDDQPRWNVGTSAKCDCEQHGETLVPPRIACFEENRQGRIVNTCGQRRNKASFRSQEKDGKLQGVFF